MLPDHHRCAYLSPHGIRCGGPATWSDDTHGAGPWYCPPHHHDRHGAYAEQIAEDTSRHGYKTEPDWHDALCQARMKELDLGPRMSYEDALEVMTNTTFGDILTKHLAKAKIERERFNDLQGPRL